MSQLLRWLPALAALTLAALLAPSCGPTVALCSSDADCKAEEFCDGATQLCVLRASSSTDGGDGGGMEDDGGTKLPLALEGGKLPDAIVDTSYAHALTAMNGAPPYTWSLGTLPPALAWLTIDSATGALSGTPTAIAPSTSFDVTVTDSNDQTATATFQLLVRACSDGEVVSCFGADAGVCLTGTRSCQSGQLGACETATPSTDLSHCGESCGACDPAAANGCTDGACTCGTSSACSGTNGDCCAGNCVDTQTDPDHCGDCATSCDTTRQNTGRECLMGVCQYPCNAGFKRCAPNQNEPGCTTSILTDVNNCGDCGIACALTANVAQIQCAAGKCTISACNTGWEDCDGQHSNGCEVNTASDVNNCGGCVSKGSGSVCAQIVNGSPSCQQGVCKPACNTGFGDCDMVYATGCEVNLTTDKLHCGACMMACATPANSTNYCQSAQCGFTCNSPYGNCDGQASNGCETNTTSTAAHCGACNKACSQQANTTGPVCQSSTCVLSCATGYRDCNNSYGDGCEINITSNATNCGACGNTCFKTNVTGATCSSSTCAITSCAAGWGNCDNNAGNGCETDTMTTSSHCGGCGMQCPTQKPLCVDGVCEPI